MPDAAAALTAIENGSVPGIEIFPNFILVFGGDASIADGSGVSKCPSQPLGMMSGAGPYVGSRGLP